MEPITISKFISRYFPYEGKELLNVTHEEIKQIYPFVERSSFEYIEEHPEELYQGKVILVTDGKKVIPYKNPQIEFGEFDYTELQREEDEKRRVDYGRHDYSNMSVYELHKLLERRFNSSKNQRKARKELEDRGAIRKKKYNRKEFKKIEEE